MANGIRTYQDRAAEKKAKAATHHALHNNAAGIRSGVLGTGTPMRSPAVLTGRSNVVNTMGRGPAEFPLVRPVTQVSNVTGGDPAGAVVFSPSDFPIGNTTVSCIATDNSGNFAAGQFPVTVVDTMAPVIMLVGANPQVIEGGVAYTELGATAANFVDGDLTGSIVIDTSSSGNVTTIGFDRSARRKAATRHP